MDLAMSFWAYMLKCVDDSYYVGHTDHLENRVAAHHSGIRVGLNHLYLHSDIAGRQLFAALVAQPGISARINGLRKLNTTSYIRRYSTL